MLGFLFAERWRRYKCSRSLPFPALMVRRTPARASSRRRLCMSVTWSPTSPTRSSTICSVSSGRSCPCASAGISTRGDPLVMRMSITATRRMVSLFPHCLILYILDAMSFSFLTALFSIYWMPWLFLRFLFLFFM